MKHLLKRIERLEVNARLAKSKTACIVGCSLGCPDDDLCEHKAAMLEAWKSDHGGNEPDMLIELVALSAD